MDNRFVNGHTFSAIKQQTPQTPVQFMANASDLLGFNRRQRLKEY